MRKEEKEILKKKIEDDIAKLKVQIAALEEKTRPITPDCSLGRLTRLEAMGEQHVNNRVLDESKLRLIRLQNALLRIDKPVFGICIKCDDPIGFERMKIRPESIRCVECAGNR
ncbi:TraR/DksA family transcriptional regulator [Sulfurovum sp. ST-21]|uniref:TraR/DksA C4-type zinc finger protein n=1 Tax=Sulfurovum indicum TaxID=2779528 RepID=A0A7M1S5Z3_9BACT|nr:TraR/DksA C4-type zinc finger protein [Sulfurovum indicum]QOR61790.1 TraR/DksA C4-type zinc finger protein [Sulfurovum indicum]